MLIILIIWTDQFTLLLLTMARLKSQPTCMHPILKRHNNNNRSTPQNQQSALQPMNAYSQASYASQYPSHPQSNGLSMNIKTERSPSYQQPQTQNYRHNSAAGTDTRPIEMAATNGIHEQASRDGSAWLRGGGSYASTSAQSPVTTAPVYSYTNGPPMNGQHMSMPPPTQSQPVLRNVHAPWAPADNVWQMQNHNVAPHQQSYPTQHS